MTTFRERSVGDPAASLRAAMAAELRDPDGITSEAVATALDVVPRQRVHKAFQAGKARM